MLQVIVACRGWEGEASMGERSLSLLALVLWAHAGGEGQPMERGSRWRRVCWLLVLVEVAIQWERAAA